MSIHNLGAGLFRESNSNVLNQLLHSCADEICGYPGPNYQQFANMNWTEDEYTYAYRLFAAMLKLPNSLYLNADKMPQEYHDLPELVQNMLMSCLRVRQEQLTNALTMEYSKKHTATITDFNWRFKMIMGSSKMASLREPLLQLDLMVEKENDQRVVALELNRDELDSLIKALEIIAR